ncbi:MarR family winged helix-turn-helix transcriptional regulator [Streptomyces uncialis]|uniref:MarR family transcriptional regulator n=1 Tax=Streptomyces uncialis TaxID=1048205 RepID=A0A1Q4V3E9_9ACTN|nr:MarR family transcriptional regulator [Streptomyces uncialis]MCX4657777.1 MarR family transcriptional regulator [Streptomyces uncialis]OKH92269.1 MarR family transcriptional regulator [Streptomyces uncialis]WST72508.1 MarR family transcriptional regulator [Streptomyces uncialis]WTE15944.1 MarR family transcriptional regulator [Streptomyces uncialis]
MGVVTALVRSSFLVNAVYAESARVLGLTPQQGQLVCVLIARPYGMSELGTTLGLAKSSLTGLVDRTARRGLVRREPCQGDARAVLVALTEEGRDVAQRFHEGTTSRIEALPAALTDAERTGLAELLARIVRDNKVPLVFPATEEAPPLPAHVHVS